MKVDIQDVLFWMDAIRNSEDRYRTLESFWKGQVNSKLWLVEELEKLLPHRNYSIEICAGWNGVLASLLFNSNIPISDISSIDIDPSCEETATTINKRYHIEGRFQAITADMSTYYFGSDIIINTSCEHLTQEEYDRWLDRVPVDSLIVLQGNNFTEIDEHIRCAFDIEDFVKISNIDPLFSGTLKLPKYDRYMIIGKRNG